jgi:hypothetical protein
VLSCRYILELLKSDLKPRDIMTYKAFENAMVTVMATGEASRRRRLYKLRPRGHTSGALHYLAALVLNMVCMA